MKCVICDLLVDDDDDDDDDDGLIKKKKKKTFRSMKLQYIVRVSISTH